MSDAPVVVTSASRGIGAATARAPATAGLGPYCVSKAALAHWTRVLAIEEPDVTAPTVQPGPVDTDMHVSLRSDPDGVLDDERRALHRQLLDEGRLRPPEVPAAGIAWLALHAPHAWSGADVAHDDPRLGRR